jgi:hypothetical protein
VSSICGEGSVQRGEVVAAEVADRRQQGGVVEVAISPATAAGSPSPGSRSRSSSAVQRSSRWYSGLLIRRSACAAPRRPALANSCSSSRPYFSVSTCQPAASNMPCSARAAMSGHDAVQRLAVEVDDPQHLAELGDHRVQDRLPDRALVQLGVPEQRVLPPGTRVARRRAPRRSAARARPRSAPSRRCRPNPVE